MIHAKKNTDRNDVLISRLRAAVNGAVIALGDAVYDEARTVFPGSIDRRPAAIIRAADTVNRDVAQRIVDYLEGSDAPMRVATLRVLGGAVARVPVEATAYAHRQSPIMVNLAAFFETAEEKTACQLWLEQFAADLDQGNPAAYVNFLSDEVPERVRDVEAARCRQAPLRPQQSLPSQSEHHAGKRMNRVMETGDRK